MISLCFPTRITDRVRPFTLSRLPRTSIMNSVLTSYSPLPPLVQSDSPRVRTISSYPRYRSPTPHRYCVSWISSDQVVVFLPLLRPYHPSQSNGCSEKVIRLSLLFYRRLRDGHYKPFIEVTGPLLKRGTTKFFQGKEGIDLSLYRVHRTHGYSKPLKKFSVVYKISHHFQ